MRSARTKAKPRIKVNKLKQRHAVRPFPTQELSQTPSPEYKNTLFRHISHFSGTLNGKTQKQGPVLPEHLFEKILKYH